MHDHSIAALFPLPLTTFEYYMLLDDRPDYPMTYAFKLSFSGAIRRPEFESALAATLVDHPLLCALVKRPRRGRPAWTLPGESKPAVHWNVPDDAIDRDLARPIDLGSEAGLRIWVSQRENATEVTLQVHHACCDGVGAMRFLGQLWAAYGIRTAMEKAPCPTLHRCDPTDLPMRGQYAVQKPVQAGRARARWNSIVDAARWLGRRLVILNASSADPRQAAGPPPFLGTQQYAFTASETKNLSQIAKRQGVSINDILVRDMFQTLQQWNVGQGATFMKRWLRIAIPVNLRSEGHDCMSAANGVSYTFVTRHGSECEDSEALLRGIHQETDAATRYRRALMFLNGFRSVERVPVVIPFYLRARGCLATVVLSNLSDITRHLGSQFPCELGKIIAGNLAMESITFAPPIRRNTTAVFGITKYGEQLRIALRTDPRRFSVEDTRRLLMQYVDRIKRTMAQAIAANG